MDSTKTESDASEEVLRAARAAALNVDALIAKVDAVLAQPLYWFPVRHHSPTIARLLAECIRVRKPKIIFIEGPHEAQAMIEFLVDSKTRPPVAIYSSFRFDSPPGATDEEDKPVPSANATTPTAAPAIPTAPVRHSVWYPIVSYSPEYVAMCAAKSIGAQAIFIDLPHFAITENPLAELTPPSRRDLDLLGQSSSLYALLAQAAGYRSWDETWDRLFETPRENESYESLRRDVAIFCAGVRATTPPMQLELDGTLPRERFMWRTIQQKLTELKLKPEDALVVCGGFHIFLDPSDTTPPPPMPEGALSVTVSPYSYFRISELSGYGAGNRAPRFYEMCFDHHSAGATQNDVTVEYVVEVIKHARKLGEPLSPADAIGAAQHALMLANLRGRRAPVLDDILDALITCCCKGNPKTDATHLLEAIDEVNIGTRLGKVTDRIGRLPIVSDFYDQLDRLELGAIAAREKLHTFTLDKRQPIDAQRSAFFHRLIFLGVQIGNVSREAAASGQSIFKEQWRVKWTPQIEPSLIERSLHGDTVEAAATTVLAESLGPNSVEAGAACRLLVQAVDMDLPQLVANADQAAGHAIDHDERFYSLATALTSLLLLERYAAYRSLGKQRLADLIQRCFSRACFAVPEAANVAPEEWENVIHGLLSLAEPVVQRGDLDADLFAASVERAARESNVPFLRGAFLGVLTEMRRKKADDLAAELLAYARGSVDQQAVAGDFLHGVLKVSRTAILLGATSLVAAIDELLRAAGHETFLSMVPKLRAAFEALHERQRDSVALHVAELYGLKESQSIRTLSTSVGTAHLMADLDAKVAAIMDEWIQHEK